MAESGISIDQLTARLSAFRNSLESALQEDQQSRIISQLDDLEGSILKGEIVLIE